MEKYEIIIYWNEKEKIYIAEVPELSGCMADGSSVKEVTDNIQTVMSEWIERAKELGWDIPKPKGRLLYA